MYVIIGLLAFTTVLLLFMFITYKYRLSTWEPVKPRYISEPMVRSTSQFHRERSTIVEDKNLTQVVRDILEKNIMIMNPPKIKNGSE